METTHHCSIIFILAWAAVASMAVSSSMGWRSPHRCNCAVVTAPWCFIAWQRSLSISSSDGKRSRSWGEVELADGPLSVVVATPVAEIVGKSGYCFLIPAVAFGSYYYYDVDEVDPLSMTSKNLRWGLLASQSSTGPFHQRRKEMDWSVAALVASPVASRRWWSSGDDLQWYCWLPKAMGA